MSSHRQLTYGLHAAPPPSDRQVGWYVLGIGLIVFWSAVILLVVLL